MAQAFARRARCGWGGCCLVFALAGSPTASALPITFVKIADTHTPAPGGPGDNFSSFGKPGISGGTCGILR